jgi:hypothetical protein
MTKLNHALMKLTFGIVAATGAAWGQNQDLAFPLGVIAPHYSVSTPGSEVTAGAGAAFQINYGRQVAGTRWGDLYVELPVIFAWRGDTFASTGVGSVNGSGIGAFVPGARFRLPALGRASFFGALGGGVGWYHKNFVSARLGSVSISGAVAATAAMDFGGGMDLRLTRLLSLRAEVRDLVTSQGALNGHGHHSPIFAFGPAFHF